MKKYRVQYAKVVIYSGIEVEAEDKKDAMSKAPGCFELWEETP